MTPLRQALCPGLWPLVNISIRVLRVNFNMLHEALVCHLQKNIISIVTTTVLFQSLNHSIERERESGWSGKRVAM